MSAIVTEAQLMAAVLSVAKVYAWRRCHFRPARTKYGWRTTVQADGAGFPDLVLVRERVIFAELKSQRGTMSAAQKEWRASLESAGQAFYLWRPSDFPDNILPVLQWERLAVAR